MNFRLFSLILVFAFILGLCACGEPEREYTVTAFCEEVTIESDDTVYEGSLNFSSAESICFEISKPERIKGLCLCIEKGTRAMKMGDIMAEVSSAEGEIFALMEMLSALSQSGFTLPEKGSHDIAFTHSGRQYTVTYSCDEKRLTQIHSDKISLRINRQ